MKWFKKRITIVTHDGSFHADDVFALAALTIYFEKLNCRYQIIRSRDPEKISTGQIVLDVGGVYDPKIGRFDHHQRGGAGSRENGIPYASFGLIWKHYGEKICGDRDVAKKIDQSLVVPIDAHDNGVNIATPNLPMIDEHRTGQAIHNFNTTWQEEVLEQSDQFNKALSFAKEILNREISITKASVIGNKEALEQVKFQNEPEILILNKYIDWEEALMDYKKIKFVVYPDRNGIDWSVQVVRDNPNDFKSNRAVMPLSWGGLRDADLQRISEVKDAIFCSIGGWFAKARSKDGAIAMAKKALQ